MPHTNSYQIDVSAQVPALSQSMCLLDHVEMRQANVIPSTPYLSLLGPNWASYPHRHNAHIATTSSTCFTGL